MPYNFGLPSYLTPNPTAQPGPNDPYTLLGSDGAYRTIPRAYPGAELFVGMPNGGDLFASTDPNEIGNYEDNAQTRAWQGILRTAALVGGTAGLGQLFGGGSAATGATPYAGATTAAGLPTGAGFAAAPLTGGTGAVGGGLLSGVSAGAGGLSGLGSAAGQVQAGGAGGLVPGGGSMPGVPSWLSNWGSLIGGGLGLLDSLNQPDSMTQTQGGTSTSTHGMQLPEQFQGAANQGLQGLLGMFGQGYQQAPLSPLFQQAGSRLQHLGANQFANGGMNFAPTTTDFATGMNQNNAPTMSGFAGGQFQNQAPTASMFAGGQTINPYLDQVFNTAADATQNRSASEFAHAGRLNSGSHQQTRSQELQNLAAGIYAPGFESERQRQYGAAESDVQRQLAQREANLGRQYGSMESGLDRGLSQMDSNLGRMFSAQEAGLGRGMSQTEANLGRQFSATEANLGRDMSRVPLEMALGDYMTQYAQQGNDASWTNLQRLLGGLGGLAPMFPGTQTQTTDQTGSVTNPLFSNPLAGFFGGAQLGRGLFGG